MPTVETIRGPVDTADLGATLMHEHVFVLSTEHVQNYGVGAWWDEDERVADAVDKLDELKSLGIDTIVDPTVWGLGRYIPRVQRVAEQTDVHIIVATELYTYDEIPHQYEHRGPGLALDLPTDPMVDDFTRDVRDGIADTGVKAAFLKCVVEAKGLTPGVERNLRACAATHRATGAPITVHTSSHNEAGRLAVQVFREEDVDLTKVVIGHAGDSNDLDYLTGLADVGCLLGMDRFGLDIYNPTEAGSTRSSRWPSGAMPTAWCWRTTPAASSTTSPTRRRGPRSSRSSRTGTSRTSARTSCRRCATAG